MYISPYINVLDITIVAYVQISILLRDYCEKLELISCSTEIYIIRKIFILCAAGYHR